MLFLRFVTVEVGIGSIVLPAGTDGDSTGSPSSEDFVLKVGVGLSLRRLVDFWPFGVLYALSPTSFGALTGRSVRGVLGVRGDPDRVGSVVV